MKILITGAAGFIGSHLVRRLIREGEEVIGLDSMDAYYDELLKNARLQACGIFSENFLYNELLQSSYPNYRFIRLKIEDRENLFHLFQEEQFDVVCNLAARAGIKDSLEKPFDYLESNIRGFLTVLEACRTYPVKHLVYASSSSVYGLNEKVPFSTSDPTDHPMNFYAVTKKSNEMMAHCYSHLYRIPTTGLRFFTVYGPFGRPDMAPFIFIRAILNGERLKLFNQGAMKRDFTYIDDVVESLVRILPIAPRPVALSPLLDTSESTAPYKLYNVGCSSPVELKAFVHALENALGKEAMIELLPKQPGDMIHTFSDATPLEETFGFRPLTSVQEGVSRFVAWYQSFFAVK